MENVQPHKKQSTKAIAFYLPQYHPIPENNEWWGAGFTEWTNVTRATPHFPGHYQPHLPADLGFYDLRLEEARSAQASLAEKYGIYGFCYYHYWFNGRRVLQRPFEEVLRSGTPDFPFCLCWANENWTRTWDGGSNRVLLEQNYNRHDDLAHIESLLPAFSDERYIRIDGKPLFLVYRTELLPDPKRTADIWRETAQKSGVGDIYLARVESFTKGINPETIGFDASVEFAPSSYGIEPFNSRFYKFLGKCKIFPSGLTNKTLLSYDEVVRSSLRRRYPDYRYFRCVTPSWDNSARRPLGGGRTIIGATPPKYAYWLDNIVSDIPETYKDDERLVFINAWNEWAEGNHLEPDQRWGLKWLEATLAAVKNPASPKGFESPIKEHPPLSRPFLFLKYYYDTRIKWRFNKDNWRK